MFFFIYNIVIGLYGLAIRCAAPFNVKAKQWVMGRKNWRSKLSKAIIPNKKVIWMHVASLGEFEQGRPVLDKLKTMYPSHFLLLSFFSPSGYEHRKNYKGVDLVIYMPLDTLSNAKDFVLSIKPELSIFVKYEFWLNHLKVLNQHNLKYIFIAVPLRGSQYFFQWYGKTALALIKNAHTIHVQSDEDIELLLKKNILNASPSGDTRFDRVAAIGHKEIKLEALEKWIDSRKCIVAGSTWPADEELLIDWIEQQKSAVCLIIVPHLVDEVSIKKLINLLGKNSFCLFSKLKQNDEKARILIIDQMGLLAQLYHFSHIAYIGGGFGKGIHNILEAAVYGVPVLFGPNYQKFNEAKALIACGGAISISDGQTLSKHLNQLMQDEQLSANLGKINSDYVEKNKGATNKILKNIREIIED